MENPAPRRDRRAAVATTRPARVSGVSLDRALVADVVQRLSRRASHVRVGVVQSREERLDRDRDADAVSP
jgi:hypothetical protein